MERRMVVTFCTVLSIAITWMYAFPICTVVGKLIECNSHSYFFHSTVMSPRTMTTAWYDQQSAIPGDSGLEHCDDTLDPLDDLFEFSHLFMHPQRPRA